MRDLHSSSYLAQLMAKFENGTAVVGVVGLGYRMLK
jgi:hypothetical protein